MAIEKFRFVSPGVQINEIDDSIIPPAAPQMGPVVIGNTAKGPAMQPVMVSSIAELERVFGGPLNGTPGAVDVWRTGVPTSPTLATYAAKAFLQNASPITVVRLAGVENTFDPASNPGWTVGRTFELYAQSGSQQSLVARIYASGSSTISLSGAVAGSASYDGAAIIANSVTHSVSLDPTKYNFIRNVLNTNPSKYESNNYFLGETFECTTGSFAIQELFLTSAVGGGYSNRSGSISAKTGYVIGDKSDGLDDYIPLFRFVGLNSGASLSKDVKISIENVRASKNTAVTKYGTFDVIVRKLFETPNQSVLERFSGVNLDPSSDNYIVKAIGDSYRSWNSTEGRYLELGTYSNRSAYIRVEMHDSADIPAAALPHGFELRNAPATLTGSHPDIELLDSTKSSFAKTKRFGLVSDAVSNADLVDLLAYRGSTVGFGDSIFHTRFVVVSGSSYNYDNTDYNADNDLLLEGKFAGFDMPLYGGFDAKDITKAEPFINNQILVDADETDSAAFRAIKQAIDMVSSAEVIDMNLLCVPGLQNADLTDYMLEVCKTRGDSMAIIDLEGDYKYAYENSGTEERPSSVSSAINSLNLRTIDNSYGAAYFPAVFAPAAGIFLPASIAALGAIGGTEGRQALWFAPAGFNRGGLTELTSGISVSRTALHLISSDRDELYETNINPIATFPNEGVVIFGQKTLQQTPSALDRVNVRRLVNYIKKEVSRAATRILFEPNVEATWNRFKSVVEPFLLQIKNGYGLDDAKVVLDETTTTADLVDRNIMYCKIYLKPTRALEYVAIDFVVTNAGAAFTE